METRMKVLLIPLDDRPVTYGYPQLLARAAGWEAIVPPRAMMGSLHRGAQIEELFAFAEGCLSRHEADAAVLCLDSLLYGGLITSRRSAEPGKTFAARFERLKKWKDLMGKKIPIYAQSSIMRISDNYDNTEEKEYWSRFGRELFEWSGCLHRLASGEKLTPGLLESLERRIPADIRQDYLDTRFRNFTVNLNVLKSMDDGLIDYLVFSQDDSGAYGLNVGEKDRLKSVSEQMKLTDKVNVYAGADEVISTLLARLILSSAEVKPTLKLEYSPATCSSIASRYEGQDIGTTIEAQIKASGANCQKLNGTTAGAGERLSLENPNVITMLVHGPAERQGDHITLPGLPDLSHLDTTKIVAATIKIMEQTTGPIILCDVAYANGGDPLLIEELMKRADLLKKVCSYAAWNTTGNTAGSAIATALCTWYGSINRAHAGSSTAAQKLVLESQKRCLFTRLVDDWAYQTKVRKDLHGEPSMQVLAELISPYIKKVSIALGYEPGVRLSFPWRRTFEIEIAFEGG